MFKISFQFDYQTNNNRLLIFELNNYELIYAFYILSHLLLQCWFL